MATQRNWKWLTEFPLCPTIIKDKPLEEYLHNLKRNAIFSKNKYTETTVIHVDYQDNLISVITKSENIKPWGVTKITFEHNTYVHEAIGSFFELNGAKKEYYKLLDTPFEEDSIDNYI